jgi:hypothetical protein
VSDLIAEAYRSTFNTAPGKLVIDHLAAYIAKLEPQDRAGAALVLTTIMLRGEPRKTATVVGRED